MTWDIAPASFSATWAVQIHQNGGGDSTGHGLVWADQNVDFIADHLTIQSQDASLLSSLTVGGTKTTGDVVGLDWTVNSVVYQIRYTVQAGDTLATITSNLVTLINTGAVTGGTVTAGFLAALLAFHDANGIGYNPTAAVSTTSTTKLVFDQPWAAAGNSVVTFLSGGATETLTLGANNTLDNGPYMGTSRWVPGRTPIAGDQLGSHYFQGQSAANSGIDTQYGAIVPRVLVPDATNPQGELEISTCDSGSAKNNNPKIYVGNGVAFATSTGANPGYPGLGNVAVGGTFQVQTRATFGSLTSGGTNAVLYAVGGANVSGVLVTSVFSGANAATPGVVLGTDSGGNRGLIAGLKYNQSSFNDLGIQTQASAPQLLVKTTGVVSLGAAQPFVWTSTSNDASATVDTGISRTGAGALAIGNGTQADASGSLTLATPTAASNNTKAATTAYVDRAAGTNSTVSAPTAPNSTSVFRMQGLAGAITPAKSGKVLVIISGNFTGTTTTAGDGISTQISHGTGSAPTTNAALTGTQDGLAINYTNPTTVTAADIAVPFSMQVFLTGLTIGTAYWIDVAAKSLATASAVALANVNITAVEQ